MTKIKFSWFILGQSIFGFLIGFLAGLSVSPVVSTLLSLLFAFIGGSIIVLIQGKTETELSSIGKSITSLSVLIIVGVITGITFRANDLLNFEFFQSQKYNFNIDLTLDEIKKYGSKPKYRSVICSIIQSAERNKPTISVDAKKLSELINCEVDPVILHAMLNDNVNCFYQAGKSTGKIIKEKEDPGKSSETKLYNDRERF